MTRAARKYILAAVITAVCAHMVFGYSAGYPVGGHGILSYRDTIPLTGETPEVIVPITPARWSHERDSVIRATEGDSVIIREPSSNPDARFLPDGEYTIEDLDGLKVIVPDSARGQIRNPLDSIPWERIGPDSLAGDSIMTDSLPADSAVVVPRRPRSEYVKPTGTFLNDIITGKNRDSLVYDARNKMVYIYMEGDVNYEDLNLKADYIEVDMETKDIYATGVTDTLGVYSRPEFYEGGSTYTMDTVRYNMDSKKAKIRGGATQEGDGFIIAQDIKKMPDNTVNMARAKYTTCDHIDHPHFYLMMSKGKVLPGEKIIVGPTYFVMEDVPIPFIGIPFGFFPISSGRSSGFMMPSYGEESVKGFFIRDGGYYFAFNDYIDVTVLGGIYTLGSWETSVASRYIKRYTFSGNLSARFSKDIVGDKGSADYINMNNFNIQWSHQQDPKFRPNSTFAASVNFSTSGYSKYGSTNLYDYVNSSTSSSISYSKSWPGKPFSLSTSFSHSQNSRDTTMSFTFPNLSFNMTKIFPFKRKLAVGRERWYEKISMSYQGSLQASLSNIKEYDLFTRKALDDLQSGVRHSIPVSTSLTLFDYLNISPTFNYNEVWHFRKIDREWDQEINQVRADTTYGFHRSYDYSMSVSATTKVYGMFQFKGENFPIRAIRHVLTPSVSFSWSPDFGDPRYGFYKPYQTDSLGTVAMYTPYDGNKFPVAGRGENMSMNFSLGQTLEMKVRNERDTSGVKKVKIIDLFNLSGSYNFLADSLNLSTISASLKTTFVKNFGLNVSATFDPYAVDVIDNRAIRRNRFAIRDGKLARLTRASTSFGYTFNSTNKAGPVANDINSQIVPVSEQAGFFNDPTIDPYARREMMTAQYYDFDIPWNLGFNYSFAYSNNGLTKAVTQSLNFNGSVTLTEKWGLNFNGGYDFQAKKLTVGSVTINRDLHCWEMSFSWVPIGYRTSWSFNIRVKSPVLRDIKWDKRSSYYDNLYN